MIQLKNGCRLYIEQISPDTVRLRLWPQGAPPKKNLMERFGLVCPGPAMPPDEAATEDGKARLRWGKTRCEVDLQTGGVCFWGPQGAPLCGPCHPTLQNGKAGASFAIGDTERFFGLGYRKTDTLELRGQAFRNHVAYGAAYGPQPLLMSSGGYGVFLCTGRDSWFDVGARQKDELRLWLEDGCLELYLFWGMPAGVLAAYTRLTGHPYLMPKAAYGLMFIANEKETQFDILRDAERIRQEGIPCGYIGLEPGWMETHYDATTEKKWNMERFYMPWWPGDRKQFRPRTFIGALDRMDFGLSLWLCCDYDIFWQAEDEAARAEDDDAAENAGAKAAPFVFDGPDFDLRAHTPIYMDKVTKKEEPWFEHLKRFIDDGAAAFKQDPAYVVNDHPDRLYAGKYTDREVHNLYGVVLAKQVHQGWRSYTGTRPMHYTGFGYTGIQRWAPSWTCDCGGREEALMGVLLSSLCGHMNITCDLDVSSPESIHFGFLLPWCQINSWAEVLQPWYMEKSLYQTFLLYARLHDALLPTLYACARVGSQTGMPILRPMPLVHPADPEAAKANRQYMLGDDLLVGAFTRRVYLPVGEWIDYWTGEHHTGGRWLECAWPADRGGPLFVRAGAVLATQNTPGTQTAFTLHLWPGGKGAFALYEDDGATFAYEEGAFASTAFAFDGSAADGQPHLSIGPRTGRYAGMEESLAITITLHGDGEALWVNGTPMPLQNGSLQLPIPQTEDEG